MLWKIPVGKVLMLFPESDLNCRNWEYWLEQHPRKMFQTIETNNYCDVHKVTLITSSVTQMIQNQTTESLSNFYCETMAGQLQLIWCYSGRKYTTRNVPNTALAVRPIALVLTIRNWFKNFMTKMKLQDKSTFCTKNVLSPSSQIEW